ncbi:hypothetical protein [Xenophilus sp. Marseille-Q4582]|uniref:hypothetical protein n=1 Tax=Xenophilus sp. Marseille-Q4582 TaxID=2866600 RepID=UPI001CE4A3DE|nr:hypothetical protein [Xenophilus sp. Marseille-Q4582]
MTEKHSPAPWRVQESATSISVVAANNETIFHDDKRIPSVIDDARLIAAAPELLAFAIRQIKRKHRGQVLLDHEDVIDLENLIAKATGEAQP